MTSFFNGKKKTSKKTSEEFIFNLQNIDVARIDKDFNMNVMKNINDVNDLIFEPEVESTSLEKLGISSLKTEPITTIVSKDKIKLQTFTTMKDYTTNMKIPLSTDIPCFGCHRRFKTVPLGIPIEYHPSIYISKNDCTRIKRITVTERKKLQQGENKVVELEYFDVDGIVCSFNCMLSVIDDNPSPLYKKSRSLIPIMYKMIFDCYPKDKIIKAPSWRMRQEYGGCISDEEFVSNLQTIQFTDMHQIEKTLRLMNPVGRVFKVEDVSQIK